MSPASRRVKAFFEWYARSSNELDVDAIAGQYGDAFMFADPIAALPKRRQFFRTLGHASTKILSLDETVLDDRHVLVRVRFSMRFEPRKPGPVDVGLDSTFVLRFDGDTAKIICQLEHQEAGQALRERGVVPPAAP